MTRIYVVVFVCLGVFACDDAPTTQDVGNADISQTDAHLRDSNIDVRRDSNDVMRDVPSKDTTTDRGSDQNQGCAPLPPAPTDPLMPTPGEFYYRQIGLGGFSIGESAMMVSPEGRVAFLDIGNDSHDDDILELWRTVGGATAPDYFLITHFHADHADGLDKLIDTMNPATIVTRGFVDMDDVRNALQSELCDTLANNPKHMPICTGPSPCEAAGPATACLTNGGSIALEFGSATIDIVAANGVSEGADFGDEIGFVGDSIENARSIVGIVSYGDFNLVFGGDLSGGGEGTDNVEQFYVDRSFGTKYLNTEIMQANHHGDDSSSHVDWLNAFLPIDGSDRNVIIGVGRAYIRLPDQLVVNRFNDNDRLGRGKVWINHDASLSATNGVENANGGDIVLSTFDGGSGYYIQSLNNDGDVINSLAFATVECQ